MATLVILSSMSSALEEDPEQHPVLVPGLGDDHSCQGIHSPSLEPPKLRNQPQPCLYSEPGLCRSLIPQSCCPTLEALQRQDTPRPTPQTPTKELTPGCSLTPSYCFPLDSDTSRPRPGTGQHRQLFGVRLNITECGNSTVRPLRSFCSRSTGLGSSSV